MSDAKVEFQTLDYEPAPDGQKPARFAFACPRHHGRRCEGLLLAEGADTLAHGIKRDGQGQNGGRPQWSWDGNRQAPTFSPSINCGGCWHGYIRGGRCVDTSGHDEPEPVK